MNWRAGIKIALPLGLLTFCLLEFILHRESEIFRIYAGAFLSLQWMPHFCLAIWCATFLFLTFRLNDLPLAGLLLLVMSANLLGGGSRPAMDDLGLLAGIALGRGAAFCLQSDTGGVNGGHWKQPGGSKSDIESFLAGAVAVLAFAAWWHLDKTDIIYKGPRWMGLWDNPDTYGMLMGSGFVLAVGLLIGSKPANSSMVKLPKAACGIGAIRQYFLTVAIFILAVGLAMSYSRGAWLATAMGLPYLAWCRGKLKWQWVLPGFAVVLMVVAFFWSHTPASAPWYLKRMDLGRPSAQHRAAAWRAGLKIMRDHPFGVGWNNAVTVYQEHYSPPEDGAGAITTNDYMMIGTELGIPALLCLVSYTVLCLRGKPGMDVANGGIQAACRAGAIVFLVCFWFDGGLFKLPTAAMFWVLLEMGASDSGAGKNWIAGLRPDKLFNGCFTSTTAGPANDIGWPRKCARR